MILTAHILDPSKSLINGVEISNAEGDMSN